MTFLGTRSGLNSVGEYQAAGLPWVTSSAASATPTRVDFPFVTNQINFRSGESTIRFGFTQNGVNGSNYFSLLPSSSLTMDIRVKSVWVRTDSGAGSFQIMAGLTTIESRQMPTLTGSAIYNSASITFEYGYGAPQTFASGTGLG